MASYYALYCLGLLFVARATNGVTSSTSDVLRHLEEMSKPREIPIKTPADGPVEVTLGMNLLNVPEVDPERNEVEVTAYIFNSWNNPLLRWNEGLLAASSSPVIVPIDDLWYPDIAAFNFAGEPEDMSPKKAVVSSDGSVVYVPFVRMRFTCDLSGVDSSSGANCTLKLGSWAHPAHLISLADPTDIDLSGYFAHSKYEILATSAQKQTKIYPCCADAYQHVDFSFVLRKKGAGAWGSVFGSWD